MNNKFNPKKLKKNGPANQKDKNTYIHTIKKINKKMTSTPCEILAKDLKYAFKKEDI
jgi:hypothetical protein